MRTPMYFSADQIKMWSVQSCGKNGLWTQARPESIGGLRLLYRLSCAWKVFKGEADVLVWLDK